MDTTPKIFNSLFCFLFIFIANNINAQIPESGTYTYDVAFAEWDGKSLDCTVEVIISGDSITIINNGSLSGEKGEIIETGKIVKHKPTGQWIIATSPEDEYAEEVGGCSDGPSIIDFKNKKWWTC
ncbi:hypothetical protein [Marinigracilibium pacificum]|uniref:Uncharacterized protein n=1 Tax=Marinigracilibium pacificum TaxID=2729599 RepID=A0A848IWN8_9BACT|nr:hypothetical protein [Marinigracilibium pacificum]NMM47695.1 hypothetical protein [Marinigracilibium pacificum]